ncbi:MAG: flavodoxin family protein [Oscillospiraceae bacterium]|nr:flavodoxin family protein [Oscillospiraceae bacterium]
MKILGLSAGTLNGANDSLCKEALMAAKEAGAEIEFINIMKLDLKHCTGCKACVMGLFSGKGNACVLKDDMQWLIDKMLDADGIIYAAPIFEKCGPGLHHTLMDRFGPRMDRGNLMIAQKIAEENGGKPIDPRYLKEKVISFMGIGGSDWATRIQCDFATLALTPKWTVIDNQLFPWSLSIIMNDEAVAKAHQMGIDLAAAAKKIADGTFVPGHGIINEDYKGPAGVCPYCHSKNFYLEENGTAICCLCGTEGVMKFEDGKYVFEFDAEKWIPHAHDSISGKFIHGDDIMRNEGESRELMATDEAKARKQKYRDFIAPSKP